VPATPFPASIEVPATDAPARFETEGDPGMLFPTDDDNM